jgi:hypothetical protein
MVFDEVIFDRVSISRFKDKSFFFELKFLSVLCYCWLSLTLNLKHSFNNKKLKLNIF